MKIFMMMHRSNYQQLDLRYPPDDELEVRRRYITRGESRKSDWSPQVGYIEERVEGEDGLDTDWLLRPADVMSVDLGNGFVVPEVAGADMVEWLSTFGEFLPQPCEGVADPLLYFNPLVLLDALDDSASDLPRNPDGTVRRVAKAVFVEDVIEDQMIFKLTDSPAVPLYFTEAALERFESFGLVLGVNFVLVWDGEPTPLEVRYPDEGPLDARSTVERTAADRAQSAGERAVGLMHDVLVNRFGEPDCVYDFMSHEHNRADVCGWNATDDREWAVVATWGMAVAQAPELLDGYSCSEFVVALDRSWPWQPGDNEWDPPGSGIIPVLNSEGEGPEHFDLWPAVGMLIGLEAAGDTLLDYAGLVVTDGSWLGGAPVTDAYPSGPGRFLSLWPAYRHEVEFILANGFDAFTAIAEAHDPEIFRKPLQPARPPVPAYVDTEVDLLFPLGYRYDHDQNRWVYLDNLS